MGGWISSGAAKIHKLLNTRGYADVAYESSSYFQWLWLEDAQP